ncbi:RbsD or FucU transport [Beutenbergia cavernae DSM 12333]|uniref:RbsD or FucU transport n=1 Tax=Beutenbergia cavernae (strain ATCC BAA-8 / DSM 12333 / CCUG 43141 / JCM 11478 / NBRC 16432 / NCIMB 13614 / HKI 0122) TaxID=471853 RepID=C5C446_BEUC1|nr:RbsD/FucU domain-containing protein [Beutenbergia cavernae]ACQ79959.1 RbsD or FucU transport [Beutenbergia cavernae DSM 12333]
MLSGIHPLLTGSLLAALDAMGHSDAVVVADAHFPAARLAARLVELPGTTAPQVVEALCTVLPLDDGPDAAVLMDAPERQPVQDELVTAAGAPESSGIDRFAFYDAAAQAFLVVRTGETRAYGNLLLRKGLARGLER